VLAGTRAVEFASHLVLDRNTKLKIVVNKLNYRPKVVICLPTVVAKDNESFDFLLKRFKKKCEKAAILSEIKKNQAYEKPSVKKKREENAARRKMLKIQRRMQRYMK